MLLCFACRVLIWEKSVIWQSPKGGRGAPCGLLSLSASYPVTPALELEDFWAFIVWGVEAAHRARGWGSHIPTETGKAQRVPQNW